MAKEFRYRKAGDVDIEDRGFFVELNVWEAPHSASVARIPKKYLAQVQQAIAAYRRDKTRRSSAKSR